MFHSSHVARQVAGPLCIALLLLCGCGGDLESTVTGTLTYHEKPVPFAEIVFHRSEGGPLPYAVTGEDGSYKAMTANKTGLQAGSYTVAVQATSPAVELPKKYGSVATSTLKYEIKPGKNVINIELE